MKSGSGLRSLSGVDGACDKNAKKTHRKGLMAGIWQGGEEGVSEKWQLPKKMGD